MRGRTPLAAGFWTLLLALVCLGLLNGGCGRFQGKYQNDAEDSIMASIGVDELPDMTFQTLDGEAISSEEMEGGQKLLIVFFSPNCSHCSNLIETIRENETYYTRHASIFLVAPYGRAMVDSFARANGLHESARLTVLLDPKLEIDRKFKPSNVPMMYLFDEERRLVRVLSGEKQARVLHYVLAKS